MTVIEMPKISYLKSCNMFFAPLDEIIESLNEDRGLNGLSYTEIIDMMTYNAALKFYVEHFDTHVVF